MCMYIRLAISKTRLARVLREQVWGLHSSMCPVQPASRFVLEGSQVGEEGVGAGVREVGVGH